LAGFVRLRGLPLGDRLLEREELIRIMNKILQDMKLSQVATFVHGRLGQDEFAGEWPSQL
jgi:hypothetical protein